MWETREIWAFWGVRTRSLPGVWNRSAKVGACCRVGAVARGTRRGEVLWKREKGDLKDERVFSGAGGVNVGEDVIFGDWVWLFSVVDDG